MKGFQAKTQINCRTAEEQQMVLDIFEMLGYKWNGGESPRGYYSHTAPMYYIINNENKGSFIQGTSKYVITNAGIEAKNLRNMYISLKRRAQ